MPRQSLRARVVMVLGVLAGVVLAAGGVQGQLCSVGNVLIPISTVSSRGEDSSTYADDKLNDGDLTTRYLDRSPDVTERWVTLDLGESIQIDHLDVYPYWDHTRINGMEVYVSNDAAVRGTKCFTYTLLDNTLQDGLLPIPCDATGRYVTLANSGDAVFSIYEIQVFRCLTCDAAAGQTTDAGLVHWLRFENGGVLNYDSITGAALGNFGAPAGTAVAPLHTADMLSNSLKLPADNYFYIDRSEIFDLHHDFTVAFFLSTIGTSTDSARTFTMFNAAIFLYQFNTAVDIATQGYTDYDGTRTRESISDGDHHIAVSFACVEPPECNTGSELKLYLNGAHLLTETKSAGYTASVIGDTRLFDSSFLAFGALWSDSVFSRTAKPDDMFDDLRIYNRVLSPAEIWDLAQQDGAVDTPTPELLPCTCETGAPDLGHGTCGTCDADAGQMTDAGLVHWLRFENGGVLNYDSITGRGSANTGGGTQETAIFRTTGSSLSLANTYIDLVPVQIDPHTIWNGNGISFAIWFKMPTTGNAHSNPRVINICSSRAGTPSQDITISFYAATDDLYFRIKDASNTAHTTSGTNYMDDAWHHIVWSISSSGQWSIYLDGSAETVSITQNVPDFNAAFATIGQSCWTTDETWSQGKYDDFRIYNRVLTAAEIAALAAQDGSVVNLIAYYKFDDVDNPGLNSAPSATSIGDALSSTQPAISTSNAKFDASAYFDKPIASNTASGGKSIILDSNSANLYNALYHKSISITFWCKSITGGQVEHGRVFYAAVNGQGMNERSFQMTHWQEGHDEQLTLITSDRNTIYNKYHSTQMPTLNTEWTHVAIVLEYQNQNWDLAEHAAQVYINGVLDVEFINIYMPEITQNYDFYIGMWTGSTEKREYDGYIDEFRIYDGVLSAGVIAVLASQTSPEEVVFNTVGAEVIPCEACPATGCPGDADTGGGGGGVCGTDQYGVPAGNTITNYRFTAIANEFLPCDISTATCELYGKNEFRLSEFKVYDTTGSSIPAADITGASGNTALSSSTVANLFDGNTATDFAVSGILEFTFSIAGNPSLGSYAWCTAAAANSDDHDMVAWRLEGYSSASQTWLLLDEQSFYAPTATCGDCPATAFAIEAPMGECRNCPIGTAAPSGSTRKADCVCGDTALEVYYELTDATQLSSSDGFERDLVNYQSNVEFSPVGAIFMASVDERLRYRLQSGEKYSVDAWSNFGTETGGAGMTLSVWVKSSRATLNDYYDWVFGLSEHDPATTITDTHNAQRLYFIRDVATSSVQVLTKITTEIYTTPVSNVMSTAAIDNKNTNFFHLAMAIGTDGQMKMYKNGVLDQTDTRADNADQTSALNMVSFGVEPYSHNRKFAGIVSHAQVYSRALTADEILALYEGGQTGRRQICEPSASCPANSALEGFECVCDSGYVNDGAGGCQIYVAADASQDSTVCPGAAHTDLAGGLRVFYEYDAGAPVNLPPRTDDWAGATAAASILSGYTLTISGQDFTVQTSTCYFLGAATTCSSKYHPGGIFAVSSLDNCNVAGNEICTLDNNWKLGQYDSDGVYTGVFTPPPSYTAGDKGDWLLVEFPSTYVIESIQFRAYSTGYIGSLPGNTSLLAWIDDAWHTILLTNGNTPQIQSGGSDTVDSEIILVTKRPTTKVLMIVHSLNGVSGRIVLDKLYIKGYAATCTDARIVCPDGSLAAVGSTSQADCVADSALVPCQAGSYRHSSDGDTTCVSCPPGEFSETTDSDACTPCPAGMHSYRGETSCFDKAVFLQNTGCDCPGDVVQGYADSLGDFQTCQDMAYEPGFMDHTSCADFHVYFGFFLQDQADDPNLESSISIENYEDLCIDKRNHENPNYAAYATHCCICGGGQRDARCADDTAWVDSGGYGCWLYQALQERCTDADLYQVDGRSAAQACCVCGGGGASA